MYKIENKITIENLTKDSATITAQEILKFEDGTEKRLGEAIRNAYVNTERQRQLLSDNFSEQYVAAIFAVWSETPAIEENLLGIDIDRTDEGDTQKSL